MFCNRIGLLINWCRKQIEAMYQVFQVLIYSCLNKSYELHIFYFNINLIARKLNCLIPLINWVFEAFIQVHTVLWSKQVVTEFWFINGVRKR